MVFCLKLCLGEFIVLSTVEEKGARDNKYVSGIQNNVRGLEKSLR